MDDPLTSFRVPPHVLEESRLLLAEPGLEGLEAVVLWIGRQQSENLVEILSVHMPEQLAVRTELGVAVTVLEDALSALIAALPAGMFVPARLHTHPSGAYHSSTDDDNMLLSHRGAISIVVPNFACEQIELARCSVNELDHRHRWRELNRREVDVRFMVR
jgi:hypothetical protein